jgi:long-chain-fatty-acid--CoA ligase ACSBG
VAVLHWSELMVMGKEQLDTGARDQLAEREADVQPGSCAVLVYTSGTTGNPKAVMTSHDNVIYEAAATLTHTPEIGRDGQERLISYLPLSHVAGFLLDVVIPIFSTATFSGHFTVFFARPSDLKDGTIGKRLQFVKPTFFFGVPRVWEKMQEKIMAVGAQTKGLKKKIATWAKGVGLKEAQRSQLTAESANSFIKVPFGYRLAKKLVLNKVKMALGLENCKMAATGAAPITVDTLEFFGKLGLQLNEVYGMSESTGLTTTSTNQSHRWGSCGFPVVGCEVKVFRVSETDLNEKTECPRAQDGAIAQEEEQGEICFRGRGIMNGYLANPRYGEEHMEEMRKKNAEAIDADGWMHSGDKGCQDAFGMVRITGRYKELIIGAGGENIAPVPIEDMIKRNAPAVSNVMMVGDKRKFNTCVVTLKVKGATGELPGGDELTGPALLVNPDVTTVSAAQKDPVWLKYVEDAIRAANLSPACPSNAAKIQKFRILGRDFSVETDEFTPTFKLKRAVASKIHAATIDEMYEE